MMKLADLFEVEPRPWWYRGDYYLWRALQRQFADTGMPEDEVGLRGLLDGAFLRWTGQPIDGQIDSVFVAEFAHGGISSGRVCPRFWRETVWPLIAYRWKAGGDAASPDEAGPRRCLREPIPAIPAAATLLSLAAEAHLSGAGHRAEQFLRETNSPAIREWTESLWGANGAYAAKGKRPERAPTTRVPARMPTLAQKRALHERDGFYCRFCGIPVLRREVRQALCRAYPNLGLWGRRNQEQHAALQAMWAQYDHVLPHACGGTNSLDNLVVTCAPCNFGRMDFTLEDANLADPRLRAPTKGTWDGLERLLKSSS
jgi:hypothetical protein